MREEDIISELLSYLQGKIVTSGDLLEDFRWRVETEQVFEVLRRLREEKEIGFLRFGRLYGYKRYLYFDNSLNAEGIVNRAQQEIISYLQQNLLEYLIVLKKKISELIPEISQRALRVIIRDMAYRGQLRVFPFLTYKNYESISYFLPEKEFQMRKITKEISNYILKEKCVYAGEISTEKNLPPKLCVICLRHLVWSGELNCTVIGRHGKTGHLVYLYFLPGLSPNLEDLLLERKRKKRLSRVKQILVALVNELDASTELIDESLRLFEWISKSDLMKGRSENLTILSCLYLAANKAKTGIVAYEIAQCWDRTFEDFPSHISSVQDLSSEILKCSRLYCRKLGLDLGYLIRKPVNFVPRILKKIGVTDEKKFLDEVRKLLDMIPNRLLVGHSPATVAATAVYVTGRRRLGEEYLTQEQVSSAACVTTATIRNILRKLEKHLNI